MAHRTPLALVALLSILVGCGGDSTEPLVPTSLELDPQVLDMEVAQTAVVSAQLRDQHGDPVDPVPEGFEVVWSSSSQGVATVDGGTVTATGPGTTTITAEAGPNLSAEMAVSVEPRELSGELTFDYSGHRSGSFAVATTFRLEETGVPDWALTFYYGSEGGQDVLAYELREDGRLDHLRFWIDADAEIDTEGTHDIDGGYIIFGQESQQAWEALYAEFVEGTVTFSSAGDGRLVGTFELTLRDEADNEIEVSEGTFDLPVVQESELTFGSPAGVPGAAGAARLAPRR